MAGLTNDKSDEWQVWRITGRTIDMTDELQVWRMTGKTIDWADERQVWQMTGNKQGEEGIFDKWHEHVYRRQI